MLAPAVAEAGAGELVRMQRVRIGLTGLAFVFVMVLLAAIFTRYSDEEPITANSIAQAGKGGNASADDDGEPKEPLAELGVAPGNADTNSATTNEGQASGSR